MTGLVFRSALETGNQQEIFSQADFEMFFHQLPHVFDLQQTFVVVMQFT
jgi:hypothetical protein